ncbi:MAG: shikimate kinase [Verrucomicrobiota bacterium]
MNDARQIENLTLVGFMGAGKSTVGRIVAEQLQFDFVDTDALIESRLGTSIGDIFDREGEAAFRQYEKQEVVELAKRRRLVIAAGGGLVMDPENMASLKTHSLVVCLWASPETLWERVREQTHRPLLQGPDPPAKIREMLAARGPAYRQADVLIHSGFRSPKELAQQLVHQFHLARKK